MDLQRICDGIGARFSFSPRRTVNDAYHGARIRLCGGKESAWSASLVARVDGT